MQRQHVEVSRATAAFTVQVPVGHTAAPAGRAQRGARARPSADTSAKPAPKPGATESRTFPAGSYIIRMDQPYSRIADAILDYQYWSPDDPQKHPYDDTGWTFPEGFAVECVRVVDTTVLRAPMSPVTADIAAPGGVHGTGATFAIDNTGDNALITLRYQLKSGDFRVAEEPFDAAGRHFARGSMIVTGLVARRPRPGRRVVRHSGVRDPGGAERRDAPGARAAARHCASVGRHADRRLVAPRLRCAARAVRLHQHARRGGHGRPQCQVRCDRVPAGRLQHDVGHRRDADVAQPDAMEDDARDA